MGIFHYFYYQHVRKNELGPPIWRHRNSHALSVGVTIGYIFLSTLRSRDLFACGRIRATTDAKTLSVSQSVNKPTAIIVASKWAECHTKMQRAISLSRVKCNTDRYFAFNKILLHLNHVSTTLSGTWTSLKEDADSAQPDDRQSLKYQKPVLNHKGLPTTPDRS
jgi:hypothetical protein